VINDVLLFIDACRERAETLGMATVVRTYGSAPRQVGAKMVVSASGALAGSVSGGCVEGAVFEALQEVMQTGVPRMLHFGVADEQAWEVGLACGGKIDVFVERLDW
jgi:xanthine/CO dehydrogenase XdhC/CoxF family maturation factor